jgi:2-hydroxy-3-keto-5-methylthiopentenyl-1-phosphate phosphatase
MKKELKFSVFVDFDGTITKKDIGDEIFKEFGEFEPYHTLLYEEKLNISEYWHIVCSKLRANITDFDIRTYAVECETDKYFNSFAEFCRKGDIPISVVSDGFESYIIPILEREGLGWLKVLCNKLDFKKGGGAIPFFPYASESCKCACASCKRNAVLSNVPPENIIIFIGDGWSDFCAAEHADIIFAKNKLAAHCNETRIPHYPFRTFFDVERILKKIILNNDAKTRHQAQLLRKKAFEIE